MLLIDARRRPVSIASGDMTVIDTIMINSIGWYDVNMTKVQNYFTYACNNYTKSHKSADSYVKSVDSHIKSHAKLFTNRFVEFQPIDLPDF